MSTYGPPTDSLFGQVRDDDRRQGRRALSIDERWAPVVGHEGRYEVSTLGRFRSVERIDAVGRRVVPVILKTGVCRSGYEVIALSLGKSRYHRRHCHRLVAEAFIPNPDGFRVVRHLDNDKTNNRVENLDWCSHSTNTKQAIADGLFTPTAPKGEDHGSAKLNDAKVRVIRRCHELGLTQCDIGVVFGIGQSNVSAITRRSAWKHVQSGGPFEVRELRSA